LRVAAIHRPDDRRAATARGRHRAVERPYLCGGADRSGARRAGCRRRITDAAHTGERLKAPVPEHSSSESQRDRSIPDTEPALVPATPQDLDWLTELRLITMAEH